MIYACPLSSSISSLERQLVLKGIQQLQSCIPAHLVQTPVSSAEQSGSRILPIEDDEQEASMTQLPFSKVGNVAPELFHSPSSVGSAGWRQRSQPMISFCKRTSLQESISGKNEIKSKLLWNFSADDFVFYLLLLLQSMGHSSVTRTGKQGHRASQCFALLTSDLHKTDWN